MAKCKQLYKNTKVWLKCFGYVVGFDVDELNKYIRQYNRDIFPYGNFFDWLTYELNDRNSYCGFAPIWNDKNPLMNKLVMIKEVHSNDR